MVKQAENKEKELDFAVEFVKNLLNNKDLIVKEDKMFKKREKMMKRGQK